MIELLQYGVNPLLTKDIRKTIIMKVNGTFIDCNISTINDNTVDRIADMLISKYPSITGNDIEKVYMFIYSPKHSEYTNSIVEEFKFTLDMRMN